MQPTKQLLTLVSAFVNLAFVAQAAQIEATDQKEKALSLYTKPIPGRPPTYYSQQTPELRSLNGRTFFVEVTESSGAFGSFKRNFTGYYNPVQASLLCFADTGNTYRRINLDTLTETSGTYTFTQTERSSGTVRFSEQSQNYSYGGEITLYSFYGLQYASMSLTSNARQGGLQYSSLAGYLGRAPQSLAGLRFETANYYPAQLPQTISFTSDRTYLANGNTVPEHYAYVRFNSCTGFLLIRTQGKWSRLPVLFSPYSYYDDYYLAFVFFPSGYGVLFSR